MLINSSDNLLGFELVRLNAAPASKADAIAEACQLLVAAGCVAPDFVASMMKRETVANTYLGHGVAIPHGLGEDKGLIKRDGIAILQVPGGLEWNPEQEAKLVVAIAAKGDAHINILRRLTRLIQDDATLTRLFATRDAGEIIHAFTEDGPRVEVTLANDFNLAFTWVVDYPAGLHARPASAWVEAVRASGLSVRVRRGAEVAEARNLVALLQLGLKLGDEVVISAEGDDALAGLARMKAMITGLTAQEKFDAARAAAKAAAAPVRGWVPPGSPVAVAGLAASPGIAIARLHVLAGEAIEVPDRPVSLTEGGNALHEALTQTRQQLAALADDTARRLGAGDAAIFKAQAELLNDSDLITLTCQLMVEGHGVAYAWHEAVTRIAARLSALGNQVLAGRAADLRDVGQRVLGWLEPGIALGSLKGLPDEACILVAGDLSPSDTAGLDMNRVVGLAMILGGPTSHTAILARTLGLPALVAGGEALGAKAVSGMLAILDGGSGQLYLNPSDSDINSARAFAGQLAAKREAAAAERARPAVTTDHVRIEVAANVIRWPWRLPRAPRAWG